MSSVFVRGGFQTAIGSSANGQSVFEKRVASSKQGDPVLLDLLENESRILGELNGMGGAPQLINFDNTTLTMTYLKDYVNVSRCWDAIHEEPQHFVSLLLYQVRDIHEKKIAHGDLSTGNIMVRMEAGKLKQLALVDFGFALLDPGYKEAELYRGTRPFSSTLAQCGVLATYPSDLESCFALAVWACLGDMPWGTLEEQINYFDFCRSKFSSDELVSLLLSSRGFKASSLLPSTPINEFVNQSSLFAALLTTNVEELEEKRTTGEPIGDCPPNVEKKAMKTEELNGDLKIVIHALRQASVRVGEQYLLKCFRTTPAFSTTLTIPSSQALAALHLQIRKLRRQASTRVDLIGGLAATAELAESVAATNPALIQWSEMIPLLKQWNPPIIIAESTAIKGGEFQTWVESHLIKMELRVTLIQTLMVWPAAPDPRFIQNIKAGLVLRTHSTTLFQQASEFINILLATHSFRYGRLMFLQSQGMFTVLHDVESLSETSALEDIAFTEKMADG